MLIRRTAIGLVLALLVALPASAQDLWKWKEYDTGEFLTVLVVWVFWAVIILGIPALAIASDESNRSMGRLGWCLWPVFYVLICVGIFVPSNVLPWLIVSVNLWLYLFVLYLIYSWLMAQRFLWRARDAGWNTKLAYLYILPLVNFIPILLLLFWPTVSEPREKASDQ